MSSVSERITCRTEGEAQLIEMKNCFNAMEVKLGHLKAIEQRLAESEDIIRKNTNTINIVVFGYELFLSHL